MRTDERVNTSGLDIEKVRYDALDGFLRITVERPLRLRWEISDDTLAAVRAGSSDLCQAPMVGISMPTCRLHVSLGPS